MQPDAEDLSFERVARLLRMISESVITFSSTAEQGLNLLTSNILSLNHQTSRSTTMGPPGPGLLAAPDILGTSDKVAERRYADAAFREVREVVFALPFSFDPSRACHG